MCLPILFCPEWPERIAHGRSFVLEQRKRFAHECTFLKSNESELLTVAQYSNMSKFEQKSEFQTLKSLHSLQNVRCQLK